ncbi:molybdopterin oxidoreductase family protein [soil metagenome]
MQKIHGVCPLDCPDTCGFITEVENDRAVNLYADPNHPVTKGWLCAKVRPYLDHVYNPNRLMHPLRRTGAKGAGEWQRISWEEAIAEIVGRFQEIVAKYGAEAILPYSYSGTLGLVQASVSNARLWNRLGASQLQRSICGAAAELAVESTLGARWSPPVSELEASRLIILWGHNPVSSAPHFMPGLRQAQRRGCQVVVIDPIRSRSVQGANLHLAPLPGTDGYLALGLAHLLVKFGLHDQDWLDKYTVGWPELYTRIAEFTPELVAAKTGLRVEDITAMARLYGECKPGLIKMADGVNRTKNGGQNVRALCVLPAVTGQYGIYGGGLAYSTSSYSVWDKHAIQHAKECPPPGRSVNMNRLGAALLGEASDPPIQALYVFNANPVTSSPNSRQTIAGMLREDLFTVVHELYLTDTARYADIVLPATSQLEHTDLHRAYGHTQVAYNRQAIAPLGECKSNWEVMTLLAKSLGFNEPWLQQTPDEIIDEILQATGRSNLFVAGITLEKVKAGGAVPMNVPDASPFAGGKFPTASGRVELYCAALAERGYDPLPGNFVDVASQGEELCLISPAGHHFVSSTFGGQDGLRAAEGPATIDIHPEDARTRGLVHGERVRIENSRGWFDASCSVTDRVRRGVAATCKGLWHQFNGGTGVNCTTSDELADFAGQSTFHNNYVRVRKLEPTVAAYQPSTGTDAPVLR